MFFRPRLLIVKLVFVSLTKLSKSYRWDLYLSGKIFADFSFRGISHHTGVNYRWKKVQESSASVMTSFSMSRSPAQPEKTLAAIRMMTLWVRRTSSLRMDRASGGLKPLINNECSRYPCKLDAARVMITPEIYVAALWIFQSFFLSVKLSTKRTEMSSILASCLSIDKSKRST